MIFIKKLQVEYLKKKNSYDVTYITWLKVAL